MSEPPLKHQQTENYSRPPLSTIHDFSNKNMHYCNQESIGPYTPVFVSSEPMSVDRNSPIK